MQLRWRPDILWRGLLLLMFLSALRPAHSYYLKLSGQPGRFWLDHIGTLPPEHSLRILVFNGLLFVGLLVFQKHVRHWLKMLADWLNRPDFRRERQIVFAFGCMVVFVFLFKLHLGFWHRSAQGWTYENRRESMVITYSPADITVRPNLPPFLQTGLIQENTAYLPNTGLLQGFLLFLHFDNGQILPANFELLNMSGADMIFRWPVGPRPQHVAPFARIIQHSLARRRQGVRFALPTAIAYPNHVSYFFIDYADYPPANTLRAITFWAVKVRITPEKQAEILDAGLINMVGLQ